MSLTPSQATSASKKIHQETQSLTPSSLIVLFEIDTNDLAIDMGLISQSEDSYIFRFHNNVHLFQTSIYWQGKEFVPAPIKAEGFELSSRGTLPTPRLSITANDDGIDLLADLKQQITRLGDLAGVKVTRIRTLLKFLDAENFADGRNDDTADSTVEFPKDVYYIDRRSQENKYFIEYELASILDVEGVLLPRRRVFSNRCPFSYRGEGCLYESEANRNSTIHGPAENVNLPSSAPPVANDKSETLSELLPGTNLTYRGSYFSVRNDPLTAGQYVYIEKDNIKYYYVAKTTVPPNTPPPNTDYWIEDGCAKDIAACKLRWGTSSPGRTNLNPFNSCLPFGGFPAVARFNQ